MSADPPRLSELLEHREFLERFARGLARDPAVADDVVQETWLTAIERPPTHQGDLRAWLRRVARNVFLQRHRARKGATSLEGSSIEPADRADRSLERESVASSIASELLALPEPYRHVLILRYYEDKTTAEIARELDRPVNTVTSQIGRGLKLMQERLDRSHPDGRTRWLPAVLALAREASRSDGRSPVGGSVGLARASAWLLTSAAAILMAFVLVRGSVREPASAPAEVLVAREDAPLVAPAVPGERTPEPPEPPATVDTPAPEAPLAPGATPAGTVVVTVVGREGDPVPGAYVRTGRDESPPGASEPMIAFKDQHETDRDGRVEIPVGDEQRVRFGENATEELVLLVQAEGFMNSDAHRLPFPEGETVALTIRITPSGTVVRGTVTDEEGAALEGALVSIGRSADGTIDLGQGRSRVQRDFFKETRADGTFEHQGVPAGTLRVQVSRPGFAPHAAWIHVTEDSTAVHDVVLRHGETVSGVVTTPDGRPVAGASILAEFLAGDPELVVQQAVADQAGRFAVRGLAPVRVWLFAQHPEQLGLTAATHVELEHGQDHPWNPVLEERPPLLLRVQSEDGAPLSGTVVALNTSIESEAWQRHLATDASGRVRFDLVPATDLTAMVYLTPEDVERGIPPCHGQEGLRASVDEQVLTVPLASLERGGLRGVVLAHDGQPFAGAVVQVRARPSPFFTGTPVASDTGAFESERLPAQPYDIVVWCAGSGTMTLGPIDVLADDTFDFGDVLLPEPTSWVPAWQVAGSPEGDAYDLVKLDSFEGVEKRWMVTSGAGPPPDSLALFPGQYEWSVYRSGERVRRETFEVK